MPTIKADGVALVKFHPEINRCLLDDQWRAWYSWGSGQYRWSKVAFLARSMAELWGDRVAERYNRIFGQEAVKDVQA